MDADNVTTQIDEGVEHFLDKYRQIKIDQDYENQEVMDKLKEERYYGNHEYKLKLVNVSEDKLIHRTTQMKFRMEQGKGEAYYEIGVHDNGEAFGLNQAEMQESLIVVYKMAKALDADLNLLYIKKGKHGEVAQLMVRQKLEDKLNVDIKILLLGDTTSGKSTLLGVMVSGRKDDGKGLARQKAFKNSHTLSNGNEWALSQTILGFDANGIVTNIDEFHDRSWDEIYKASYKVLSFLDIEETPETIKKCVPEMPEAQSPNYALLWITASQVNDTCKEQFRLALELKLPIIIVVSKIDKVDESDVIETIFELENMVLDSDKCDEIWSNPDEPEITDRWQDETTYRSIIEIEGIEDAVIWSTNMAESVIPVFKVSNTTWEGVEVLLKFLNLLVKQ